MRVFLACALLTGVLASPAQAATTWWFTDVPVSHYAASAIWNVAHQHDWLRDFGTGTFNPNGVTTRRQFAVAMVRAFARFEILDPLLVLKDVAPTLWFAGAANVAVTKGWLGAPNGVFSPDAPLTKVQMDIALIDALGLDEAVAGLNNIHTANGYRFKVPYGFGPMILSAELGLHDNLHDESKEMLPNSGVRRAEAAFALWKAVTTGNGWVRWSMERYKDIELPTMRAEQGRAVQFALQYAGYPYIYAGEWYRATGPGFCCGSQPQGGYDCSGFVWWVLHSSGPGFNNAALRGYNGWYLPDRSSASMARGASRQLSATQIAPMDIMLFDTDGPRSPDWRAVSHAGLALGNGWMIHSSGHRGGVSISWVGDGYWADHLAWGRRVIPGPDPVPPPPPPPPTPTPTPSDSPTPSDTPTPEPTNT